MAIIWCGGEDIDFPAGNAPVVQTNTSGGSYRNTFSRCALYTQTSGAMCSSLPFASGAKTSAWLSARVINVQNSELKRGFGFGLSGQNKGLFVGGFNNSGTTMQLTLNKWDGTTDTRLGIETGTSLGNSANTKVDLQVANYGATATVNVYANGVNVITYSGDVTVSGMSNFNCVAFGNNTNNPLFYLSEFIVADEDTRGFPGLVTLALTGAGTTDQWTGVYSTINGTSISDTTPNYTNVVAQDQQFNVTDLSGISAIRAVKVAARASVGTSSTATRIALGYNSGGTVAVGSNQTLGTAFGTIEQLDLYNPVTGVAFVQSDMNGLQIDVRSA